jgi:hypothetical protein
VHAFLRRTNESERPAENEATERNATPYSSEATALKAAPDLGRSDSPAKLGRECNNARPIPKPLRYAFVSSLAPLNFRLADDASKVLLGKVCSEAYRLLCSGFILEDGNGGSHTFTRVEPIISDKAGCSVN